MEAPLDAALDKRSLGNRASFNLAFHPNVFTSLPRRYFHVHNGYILFCFYLVNVIRLLWSRFSYIFNGIIFFIFLLSIYF